MKTVGDAFKMPIHSYIQDHNFRNGDGRKSAKSAISPCQAQPKFRTRFDNPEISLGSWLTSFDIAEICKK